MRSTRIRINLASVPGPGERGSPGRGCTRMRAGAITQARPHRRPTRALAPGDRSMYGLSHRIAADPSAPAPLPRVGERATVVVLESDPSTLAVVQRAVAGHYRVVAVRDAAAALDIG